MQDKILSVFYAEDRLPYKDASRETHYPIVNGNVFNGANNVTKIRYYLDRIGGFTNVTWAVVSKLPNGQLASEVLNSNNKVLDSELGEYYIDFEISSYYTTLKGDVYLSLQGYQGGVEMEQDEDTGIYSIYGTPTIQATGSIKISVNYAPQIVQGTHFNTSDLQQVLGLISDKANISDTFILLDSLAADISGFNVGQVFFDKQTKSYWVKGNDNSLQSFDVKLERAVTLIGTETIANLVLPNLDIANWGIGKYNDTLLFVKVLFTITPTPHIEYTIYQLSNTGSIKCWYNNNATGNETIAQVLATTPTNVYATQEYVESNYVKPSDLVYTRGSYLVTDITTTTIGDIYSNVDTSETFSVGGSNVLFRGTYLLEKGSNLGSNYNFKITCIEHNSVEMIGRYWETTLGGVALTTTLQTIFNNLVNTPATTKYVDDKIADFMQKEYQNVDTTTYPTLDDFLASTGTEGYIYLYPIDISDETKGYYQYIWENNAWVSLGTTQIDLSDYYTKTQADDKFATITYVDNKLDTKQDTLVSGTNIKTLNGSSLLGSGNIEYDDEFDEESTNALQNQVISKEIKELNYELAIIREELFEVLLTELDYKVSYAMNYVIPDSLSDSDGTHRLVYSETMLKDVEGNGVALNQWCEELSATYYQRLNTPTISFDNGVASVLASASANGLLKRSMSLKSGHKYLAIVKAKGSSSVAVGMSAEQVSLLQVYNGSSWSGASGTLTTNYSQFINMFTMTADVTNVSYFRIVQDNRTSNWDTIYVKELMLFDLTQMFGAGNEPASTSDVRIQWLLSLGYVPYNEGSLKNTTISGIKLIGNNKFDEELEQGSITGQGELQNNNYACRSKNYISVFPNTSYTMENSLGYVKYVCEYDINKTFIDRTLVTTAITLKANTRFVKIYVYNSNAQITPTTSGDITFHLTSASIGYKPYIETTISLPQTTLLGALNSHDTLSVVEGNVVEGEQLYNIVKTTNVGTLDLGNLNYNYDSANARFISQIAIPNIGGEIKENAFYKNDICALYRNSTTTQNKTFFILSSSKEIYIYDSAYTNATTFKTAMSGVMLQYELATPTKTIVAQDLHFDQVSSVIEQGGTIEPIFEDVPPNITTTFVVKKAVGE